MPSPSVPTPKPVVPPLQLPSQSLQDAQPASDRKVETAESPEPQIFVETPEQRPHEHLTKNAIEKRLRRVFQARSDGTYLVSEDFVKQYKSKGEDRNKLMVMFEKLDYNPDKGVSIFYIFG